MSDSTIIVCLGNELAGDDGIGFRVGRVLRAMGLPARTEVVFRPEVGLDLLDLLDGCGRLVLVDAARSGQPPGTVRRIDLDELLRLDGQPMGCHGLGLGPLLEAGQALGHPIGPSRVAVVSVEVEEPVRFSTRLSEQVRTTLTEAVAQVLAAAGATDALVEAGRAEADRWLDFVPEPDDLP